MALTALIVSPEPLDAELAETVLWRHNVERYVAASVDEPLLNDHRAGLVPGHRAGMRTDRGVPGFRALDALTSPLRLDHVGGVRRMDDVVRVPMEDDGANAWAVVRSAARLP